MSTRKKKQTECSFSLAHYSEILKSALDSGYKFVSYEQIDKEPGHLCTLRHDIDYMPLRAASLGIAEHEMGISAYYFFLVNSEIYNLRDRRVYKVVQLLEGLGHKVGLHFDLAWDPQFTWEQVADQCDTEKRLLKTLTGVEPCEIVSFHNPHTFTDLILNKKVEGISHTYEKQYFTDIKYLSDSQGWYEGCVCEIFNNKVYEKLQVLTHPYIWPHISNGDFISDMADMVNIKRDDISNYMINYHPKVREEYERFREMQHYRSNN